MPQGSSAVRPTNGLYLLPFCNRQLMFPVTQQLSFYTLFKWIYRLPNWYRNYIHFTFFKKKNIPFNIVTYVKIDYKIQSLWDTSKRICGVIPPLSHTTPLFRQGLFHLFFTITALLRPCYHCCHYLNRHNEYHPYTIIIIISSSSSSSISIFVPCYSIYVPQVSVKTCL